METKVPALLMAGSAGVGKTAGISELLKQACYSGYVLLYRSCGKRNRATHFL